MIKILNIKFKIIFEGCFNNNFLVFEENKKTMKIIFFKIKNMMFWKISFNCFYLFLSWKGVMIKNIILDKNYY